MLKLLVFVLTSAIFVYVSRASLHDPRSHGFYRFFAWEAALALTLLNLDHWFYDPLTWHQLVSWPLLMASLFLAIHGVQLLKQAGRQDPRRDDAPMLEFEKTTTLVTAGAYRYIRHPLYGSLLFPTWIGVSLALAASLFLVITAKTEEAENVRFFGPAYQVYMQQTRMFIPFLF